MISLSRHIELLLLEHNCVIVPGLGGFIANMSSAVYNGGSEGDKLFMPPYRTIGFNPQLQVNDGLLVQSYMQAYDASYPAAYLQMEKEIEQLNIQLNLVGEYHLEGIGTLHKSLEQGIALTSPESGILTPVLYGTYSFTIHSLAEVEKKRAINEAAEQTNIMPIQTEADFNVEEKLKEKKEEEHVTIPIKRKDKNAKKRYSYLTDFAIASAVAAIIFMTFLIPNIKTMNGEKDTYVAGALPVNSNTNKNSEITKQSGKQEKANDTASSEMQNKAEGENAVDNSAKTTATDANETNSSLPSEPVEKESKTKAEEKKNYTIVLASFVSEANSNILIKNLASQGFGEARFIRNGKTTRVIYSAYTTEQEAREALVNLRQQNENFNEAWTLELK